MWSIAKKMLLITCSIALTACGFHLRTAESLPSQLRTIYVQSYSPYGLFTKQLQMSLQATGVKLTTDIKQAPFSLRIINDGFAQQNLGSLANYSQINQIYIYFNVTYAIYDHKGKNVYGPNTITTQRAITTNTNQMLGSSNAESEVHKELVLDAINQLINQLTADKIHTLLLEH